MSTSIQIKSDAAFTGAATDLAAFIVPSCDPAEMTKTSTHFTLDALTAYGYATGALPATGASLGAGGLVNVANDNPPALPSAAQGAVTATLSTGAQPVVRIDANGRGGLDFTGAGALNLHQSSVADNLVGNPVAEGYIDFVVTAWVMQTTLASGAPQGVAGCGTSGSTKMWGWYLNQTDQSIREALTGATLLGLALNSWYQIGAHYSFNTTSGAITVRLFANGAEIGSAAVASTTIATMAGWPTAATRTQVGSIMAFGPFSGVIADIDRVFTALAGHIIDPAVFVAAEYAANKTRIAGL